MVTTVPSEPLTAGPSSSALSFSVLVGVGVTPSIGAPAAFASTTVVTAPTQGLVVPTALVAGSKRLVTSMKMALPLEIAKTTLELPVAATPIVRVSSSKVMRPTCAIACRPAKLASPVQVGLVTVPPVATNILAITSPSESDAVVTNTVTVMATVVPLSTVV